jgi:hypothetical protein|tara:strand:+ start:859 stop:1098 length:240 start_codon:yes stop_codon:yes gene_type:complete
MGKANMTCMHINIWVHHMDVDQMFDFLNNRIKEAPDYYLSSEKVPNSITGGYVSVALSFEAYSLLTSIKDWEASDGWMA